MQLRYGTLADYSALGAGGKPLLIGMFDTILVVETVRPVRVPPCYLFGIFEAHATEGTDHRLTIRLQTADGQDLMPTVRAPLRFGARGPGRPLIAYLSIALFGLALPDVGEYAFELLVDDRHVGSVQLYTQLPLTG
jgi:hypothetical protein